MVKHAANTGVAITKISLTGLPPIRFDDAKDAINVSKAPKITVKPV